MTRSLIAAVCVPLGPLQRRALEIIEGWDFTREAAKTHTDLLELGQTPSLKFIEDGIFALRQYHAIALLDPLNGHAISDTLDPFWHSQILFTEQYVRFCDLVFGQYMHHYPLDHTDRATVAHVRRQYDYTADEVYPKIFGESDPVFYPTGIIDARVICNHAKDCNNRPHAAETVFPERADLLAAAA